ncbi:MAG TPA: fatty acid--CoA ligase family protein, partial [Reyranella sp.]
AAGESVRDPRFPLLRRVILLGSSLQAGTVDWTALAGAAAKVSADDLAARARAVDPAATAFIMYTSGTTGFPKGVVRTHALIGNVEERAGLMAITADDTILNYLPLFHAFGLSEGAWMSLVTGARQILTRGFDPDESLDLIEKERVSVIHGFEAHMKGLAEAQEARPRDLISLRTGIFAAGMLSATPVVRRGMRALAPIRNLSGYGMTETWLGVALSSLDDDEAHRSEASGWPGPGFELRIVDDGSGKGLGPGVAGELQVRGGSVMTEYYRKPAETAASFTPDGWFRTGDAAMWLADGCLRFLGRYKDMLKVGGENVAPAEIEALLLELPGVADVSVVGYPDARLNEVAAAFVIAADGAPSVDPAAVHRHCYGRVASFKIPRHVFIVESFPMTPSGKVQKVKLREIASRHHANAVATREKERA